MGQISKPLMQSLDDRIAKQASLMSGTLVDAKAGISYYRKIHSGIPAEGDFQVENDLISPANALDNFSLSIIYSNLFNNLLNSIISHVASTGGTSLDTYLFNSGLNLSDPFAEVHNSLRSTQLKSVNVFGPETQVGTISVSGANAGSLSNQAFVGDGTTPGATLSSISNHTDAASSGFPSGKHAAARMKVIIASGLGSGADTTLVLRMIDELNQLQVRNVFFSSAESEIDGTTKEIGSGGDFFLGFSGLTNAGAFGLSGIVGGSAGLVLEVQSILERNISL